MQHEALRVFDRVRLDNGRLIMGFSGWMDGGDVSTGTVEYLIRKLGATKFAEIDPSPFYIYSFPGSMEVASLFRPHVKIEDGVVAECDEPASTFYCSPPHNVVLFTGREPNLHWREFAECLFSVVSMCNITTACFVGSFAGLTPHTREPRLFSAVSAETLRPLLKHYDLNPSAYEGPGSFTTFLTALAHARGLELFSLVAEIPAYVEGRNPKCIETVMRKVAAIFDLTIDLSDLDALSRDFEKRINDLVKESPELAEQIHRIEEDHDHAVVTARDDELKAWLEKQGIRLD